MVRIASFLFGLSSAASRCCASADTEMTPIQVSHDAAEANAYHVFNAIHSAGRQWGSSIYHNGFGFFPAVMPKGTLTYHGGTQPGPPTTPEWLAFEVEHAEQFASSRHLEHTPEPPPGRGDKNGDQRPLGDSRVDGIWRGYLHMYRANRDLNMLYADGMSAGKSNLGTLDSQDLVLRETISDDKGIMKEWERAVEICDIISEWGYDGLMRTEVGFEVIYCDFSNGLDLVSSTRTFALENKVGNESTAQFQWARAVAERYDDLGGGRARIDFSSMVSGFFFPINISSTSPNRPDLIRLGAADKKGLRDVKDYLHSVATQPRRFTVDWQAVVDMIVTRYAKRLALMQSDKVSMSQFIDELETATLTYVHAPPLPGDISLQAEGHEGQNETDAAIDRRIQHYLLPALTKRDEWSLEDELIYTSVRTTMHDICYNLFAMRSEFLVVSDGSTSGRRISKDDEADTMRFVFGLTRKMSKSLVAALGWTEWKKARPCQVDEILFVAMWPFGSKEDHWHPGCRSSQEIGYRKFGYWLDDSSFYTKGPEDREGVARDGGWGLMVDIWYLAPKNEKQDKEFPLPHGMHL